MDQPLRLYGDRRYRIMFWPAPSGQTGRRLLVTFEHGRSHANAFQPPQYPQLAKRFDLDVMAIQTSRRDWYISHRSTALSEELERLTTPYPEVVASGFSMGAYAALLYSRAANIRRVLAVSPQFSIDPKIADFDPKRHRKFKMIGRPMPEPQEQGDTLVTGLLVYDPSIVPDRRHAQLIHQHFTKLTCVPLPFSGHPASQTLGDGQKLGMLGAMVVQNNLNAAEIFAAHRGARRGSHRYRLNLAIAASKYHSVHAIPVLRELATNAQHDPDTRLTAALTLMDLGDPRITEFLMAIVEQTPNPSRQWQERLMRAISQGEKNGLL